ncbi:hypothetical protein ROHU_009730 [Labeo rohita]|uniref:Uncharacterized protein n=1 Tax=Labeo rohita TaxID=84645 RepID=A0A498M1L5_LABRO|nr:hypothetical protein ROHU_009730 [Labeo rohita]
MGRSDSRFEILASRGPLAQAPEARAHRTAGKKGLAPSVPRSGMTLEPPCRISGPWEVSEKIPPAIYLNGFGLAGSWTRFRKGRSSRIRNLRLEGTPSTGPRAFGASLGDGPGATVPNFGPLGRF